MYEINTSYAYMQKMWSTQSMTCKPTFTCNRCKYSYKIFCTAIVKYNHKSRYSIFSGLKCQPNLWEHLKTEVPS